MDESDATNSVFDFDREDSPVRTGAGNSSSSVNGSSRTSGIDKEKEKGKKPKRLSKTAAFQAEYEQKLNSLEESMNSKFDALLQLLQSKGDNGQNRENIVLPRSDHNVDNVPHGERRPLNPVQGNDSISGVRRPIIPLEPNLDQDLGSPRVQTREVDMRSEISLHVNGDEREFLEVRSDPESDNDDTISCGNIISSSVGKTDRFTKHVVTTQDEHVESSEPDPKVVKSTVSKVDVLSKVFKEDINKVKTRSGLILDQAQVDILSNSWRCQYPERLSAYKEEYKNCFPINDNSVEFLQVPTLDDLLEVMLRQTHGQKAVKNWDQHRQLYNQPYKQIEKLGFQGQLGSRMNIISLLYIQQALASLAQAIESGNVDKQSICESIRDIFAMSTKSLDQAGRTGAFFHLIRRKAAAQDAGLSNLPDLRSKCQYLPLTEEGLFGKALETCLEKRKEQKDQLNDLLPEYCSESNRKRKLSKYDNEGSAKKPKHHVSESGMKGGQRGNQNITNNFSSGFSNNRKSSTVTKEKASTSVPKKDGKSGKGQSSWGSFRIPKKNDS